jgi:hypothetical protein
MSDRFDGGISALQNENIRLRGYAELFAKHILEAGVVSYEPDNREGLPAMDICSTCGQSADPGVPVPHDSDCPVPQAMAFMATASIPTLRNQEAAPLQRAESKSHDAQTGNPVTRQADVERRSAAYSAHPNPEYEESLRQIAAGGVIVHRAPEVDEIGITGWRTLGQQEPEEEHVPYALARFTNGELDMIDATFREDGWRDTAFTHWMPLPKEIGSSLQRGVTSPPKVKPYTDWKASLDKDGPDAAYWNYTAQDAYWAGVAEAYIALGHIPPAAPPNDWRGPVKGEATPRTYTQPKEPK